MVTDVSWLVAIIWMRHSGWRIQARCLSESGVDPLPRRALLWTVGLVGAVVAVVYYRQAGACGPVVVTMVGGVSAVVDARCHRLPTRYTAVMAGGVLFALISCGIEAVLGAAQTGTARAGLGELALDVAVGIAVWVLPLGLGHATRAGVGMGDVRLAPVLGAMLGTLGWEAAVAGLVVAFLAGGAFALWRLASGSASVHSRIAMGPALIGGSLISYFAWGITLIG